jgi:tetratricopeptide (TPR) repeat protein
VTKEASSFRSMRIVIMLVIVLAAFSARATLSEEQVIDSLRNALTRTKSDTNRIKTLYFLSEKLVKHNTYESMKYAREALALSDSLEYKVGKAVALGLLGNNSEQLTDYKQAIFYYLQALRLFEELGNVRSQGAVLNYIGIIYMWLEKYDVARKYYLESLRMNARGNYKKALRIALNNLGIIAFKQKKYKEAEDYYLKAANASRIYNDTSILAAALINLGELYAELENYKKAESYYRQTKELNSNTRDQINAENGLGYIYMESGDLQKAHVSLMNSKELAVQTGNINSLLDIYKNIGQMYERKKDFKHSLEYYRRFHELKDSIYNEKNAKQINEIQTSYQLEKKDKEIQLLNQSRQIAETSAEKEHLLRNFSIALLGLIVIIGIVIARNMVLRQRVKNRMLSEKNTLIEKDNVKLQHENIEARYETLKSKTNPHFLFNNLTVLSSLIIKDQRSAIEYVEHFSELYRMILKTGEQKLVTLGEEMKLVEHYLYVQQVWYKEALQVSIDIDDHYNELLLPSFALQMLVENAVKHNVIMKDAPLFVSIKAGDDGVVVKNTLQKKLTDVTSTNIGQKNIIERYKLVTDQIPLFIETGEEYIARVPLIMLNKEPVI